MGKKSALSDAKYSMARVREGHERGTCEDPHLMVKALLQNYRWQPPNYAAAPGQWEVTAQTIYQLKAI